MAKMWEQPWTTEEMRASAGNWNLAGDAGLLKHLQQFSQNLIGRIHTTNSLMDDSFRKLNNVSTEINNLNNTFLSLANTQFVENRVYEDEEKDSPNSNKEQLPQPKSKEALEAEMIQRVKQSLENGFAVMDTKFNAIEVSGSDSEEEGSPSSVIRTVLEPKNPYLHWPLPHLIGSSEFMGDDSVGLITANEDVMTPPLTTHSSASDLNEDLVQESRESLVKQASDWLSETEDVDMFGRDSSPEELDFGAPSSQQEKSAASFAEELSSKLGGVASPGTNTRSADLWDEPAKASASLSDSITSTKNSLPTSIPSLFGPSNDLFHDDDDDDIFTIRDKKKPDVSPLFDENKSSSQQKAQVSSQQNADRTFLEPKPVVNALSAPRNSSTPNVDAVMNFHSPADISSSTLFDQDDEDDDLFTVSPYKQEQVVSRHQSNDTSNSISVPSAESSSIPIENIFNIPIDGSSSSGLFSISDGSNVPLGAENLSANLNKTAAVDNSANQSSQGWLDEKASDSNSLFDEDGVDDSLFQPVFHRAVADVPPPAVNKRPLSLFDDEVNAPVDAREQTEGKMSEKSLFDDEDLFSQSSHEPKFDIFGGSQGKIRSDDDLFSVQPAGAKASDTLNSGSDETDDIFSVSQIGSTFNDDVEDLFSSSPSQKSQSSEPKMTIFSAPQISSTVTEGVKDLFSSFPSQKQLPSEPKMNPPTTSSKPTADLFLDTDDSDTDLFGFKANALSNDGAKPLFRDAPLQAKEKESEPQLGHIPGDKNTFSEPLKSQGESSAIKPNENDKEKQPGISKKPLPAPRKVETNEPFASVVTEEEATAKTKPWSKDKVIGKIKSPIGFIVDPLALLPGSKPPPREKTTVSEQASGSALSRDNQAVEIAGTSSKEKDSPDAASTAAPSSSSFDDSKVAPTLHSAVKERAKIQVKRRPQSRRARHEAIRSSALLEDVDFGTTPPKEVPTPIAKEKSPEKLKVDTVQKLAPSENASSRATILSDTRAKSALTAQDIASPSTDEEDLFGVPQIIYKDKGELEDTLFGSATVLSPYDEKDMSIPPHEENSVNSKSPSQPDARKSKVEQFPKTSSSVNSLMSGPFSSDENLFSSSTSDTKGGLFLGTGSSKIVPKKTSFSGSKGTTKSLFDDEDDDDIFSKPPKTPLQVATKSAQPSQMRANPPVVKSSLKKTEDPFNDPLTSLPQ